MNSIERVSSIQLLTKSGREEMTAKQTQTIFHTVYRITRNHEDAEDAMQDAFIQALVHLEDFDGRAAFSTWLTRIAINAALMILRKRKNTRGVSLDGPSDSEESKAVQETRDPAADAKQQYLQKERETILQDAIKELRLALRSVVELGVLGERPMREVAEIVGVSVAATKGRLFHARETLRDSAKLRRIKETEVTNEDDPRRRQISRNGAVSYRGRSTPILCRNKCYHRVRRIRSVRETSDCFDQRALLLTTKG